MKIQILLISVLLVSTAQATKRVSAIEFNKETVTAIYTSPGLVTAVLFPCEIEEAISGNPAQIGAFVALTSKSQLNLYSKSSNSKSTNLLVRCKNQKDLYVFDLVPSKTNHQDVVKIDFSFGRPGNSTRTWILKESSAVSSKQRTKRLISSSERTGK